MGGMIVQTMAIEHRERLLSMTSIMSTTGDPDVGQPDAEVLPILMAPAAPDREAYVQAQLAQWKLIGSPDHYDPERVAEQAGAAYDRAYWPRAPPTSCWPSSPRAAAPTPCATSTSTRSSSTATWTGW